MIQSLITGAVLIWIAWIFVSAALEVASYRRYRRRSRAIAARDAERIAAENARPLGNAARVIPTIHRFSTGEVSGADDGAERD